MKSALTVSIIALLLSAAAIATLLARRPGPDTSGEAPVLAGELAAEGELRERLEELAAENRALRDRLAMLELRAAPEARTPVTEGFATREELEALREELFDALAGGSPLGSAIPDGSSELEERVAGALTAIRKQEAVDKARARQEDRSASLEDTMPKIEQWLELSPHQSNEMRSALLAQYDRETDLIRRWEAGEDPELLGEQKRSDREAFQSELALFLSADQLETFLNRGGGK